jgi:hypothetical protein
VVNRPMTAARIPADLNSYQNDGKGCMAIVARR